MIRLSAPAIKLIVFAVVTIVLTGLLAMTVASSSSGPTSSYAARFTDASGLASGDDVRIDGVVVGKVTSLQVVDGKYAQVNFQMDADRRLSRTAIASVKYRNLAGQRYLALDTPIHNARDVLPADGILPLGQTRPALNLTELFNGFKPLFQALSPQDVNKLSYEIIQVLQGEGGTVDDLLTHTASLTQTVAKKDQVIGKTIDNLNTVLAAVNARSPQLSQLIDALQHLVSGLAQQRQPVGQAITALDGLTQTTAGLLQQARPPLRQDIGALQALTNNLEPGIPQMEHDLQTLPFRLDSLTRTVSYGSWFNFYLCQFSGTVGISSLNIKVPVTPIPPAQEPPRCQS